MRFLALAGCRFSEMCPLRVDDVVQPPHGLGVRIHRAAPQSKRTSGAVFGPTKTHPKPAQCRSRRRSKPTSGTGSTAPRPARTCSPSPTGAIWTNTNFRVRSRWTETTQAVGLAGTTIHDLRHTAASLLIAAGADVKAVQMILGHATATMTMDLYGHLFSEAPWVAMERMPTFPEPESRIELSAGDAGCAVDGAHTRTVGANDEVGAVS